MNGIHVNWTKPYFHKERLRGHAFKVIRDLSSQTYNQPDYQIFYTMLSAIHWKRHNGPIKLYTDSIGLNFMQQFKMADLYDEIDINFLNGYSKTSVDPANFWTSGKIKCLAHQTKPFVFLDQDMIIRQKLPEYVTENDLTITHWEIPRGQHYFTDEEWKREITHMELPKNYRWTDWTPNTSFLAVNNMKMLRKYTDWHKKLVEIGDIETPVWYWLFTDQGILGHVIRDNDYKVDTLTDKIFLSEHNFGTLENRYKGIAAPWYLPTDMGIESPMKTNMNWEHVWIEKIHYGMFPDYQRQSSQRFFTELVDMGFRYHLQHSRFKSYWDEYESKNS